MSVTDMGLRADEARKILETNGYSEKKYAHVTRAVNDGSGYLYGLTGTFGGFVGFKLGSAINCTVNWIQNIPGDSNPSAVSAIFSLAGLILGVGVPYALFSMQDKMALAEAERINKIRKQVMEVINNNYTNIEFHSPLKEEHVVTLLTLTDENTKNELKLCLNAFQRSMRQMNASAITQWEEAIENEKEIWCEFQNKLKNSSLTNADYNTCKAKFGEEVTNTFVKNNINDNNVQIIGQSIQSDVVNKACDDYFLKNGQRIFTPKFFPKLMSTLIWLNFNS